MRLLILVFAVSIAVLLGAAWAIARAVRRHGKPQDGSAGRLEPDQPETTNDESEEH